MGVDVLIVGGGGREHALAWKLKQSPRIGKLYIAPGNAGTRLVGENVAIGVLDFEHLAKFAEEKKISLTIVGPDDPLGAGIVDFFQKRGLRIFGPSQEAAQIESSKAFSKELMKEAGVPTAEFRVFTAHSPALAYVHTHGAPVVVKASGLALGKGVYICKTVEEAERALQEIMVDRVHKDAGNEVVIEDFLEGPEVSIHALADGLTSILFPSSQDHKAAGDGDTGKNTGGMGTIAPSPFATPEVLVDIEHKIVRPTMEAMNRRNAPFCGLLYPGIMVTVDGIKVLEYNARFGDPECQVYMRLLKSDLLDLLEACADRDLTRVQNKVEWERGYAVNIVLASGGYPDAYKKGFLVSGIEEAESVPGVVIFHAGTTFDGGTRTAGGRVLGVSATGVTLKEALDRAYTAVGKIHFEGMQFRRDIGAKALHFISSVRV